MMKTNRALFIFVISSVVCSIFACVRSDKKAVTIPQGWVRNKLYNRWTIYLPPGFLVKNMQGIDSHPGDIYSKKDSIVLRFDSGGTMWKDRNCSFQNNYLKAKGDIDTGFYRQFYKVPVILVANIDTIDNEVAIVVRPVKTGKGIVGIELLADCKTGDWLSIRGENLSAQKEKLVLKIFQTIKLEVN